MNLTKTPEMDNAVCMNEYENLEDFVIIGTSRNSLLLNPSYYSPFCDSNGWLLDEFRNALAHSGFDFRLR